MDDVVQNSHYKETFTRKAIEERELKSKFVVSLYRAPTSRFEELSVKYVRPIPVLSQQTPVFYLSTFLIVPAGKKKFLRERMTQRVHEDPPRLDP